MAAPDTGNRLPQSKKPSNLFAIPARVWSKIPSIAKKLQSLNEWIAKKFHWSAPWILRFEIGGCLVAGMTAIQVEEYAAAVFCWAVLTLIWVSKAVGWNGLSDRPRSSMALRIGHALLAVAICAVLITWTNIKRGNKVWTAFEKPGAYKAEPKQQSDTASVNPLQSPSPTPITTPSSKEDANDTTNGELRPAIGLEIGQVTDRFDDCSKSGIRCLAEAAVAGKTLPIDFHGKSSARIAALLSIFPGANENYDFAHDTHVVVTSSKEVALDYAGERQSPYSSSVRFFEELLETTPEKHAPERFLLDISLRSRLSKFPLTVTVWGREIKRHAITGTLAVDNWGEDKDATLTKMGMSPTPSPATPPTTVPLIERVDWHDKQNWRKLLHPGMTKAEVHQLFGDPEKMSVISDGEFWDYGRGGIQFYKGLLWAWHEP